MQIAFVLDPPDASACGPILDQVPYSADAATGVQQYAAWKQAALAELATRVSVGQVKMWVPLDVGAARAIPFYGGNPATDWSDAVAVMMRLGQRESRSFRVVDLSGVGVVERLHPQMSTRFPGDYKLVSLGAGGTLDPLQGLDVKSAGALLANVFRAEDDRKGRNSATITQSLLGQVIGCLDPAIKLSIRRLHEAVVFAQTGVPSLGGSVLTASEQQQLLTALFARLQNSRPMADGMFEIDALVGAMVDFDPASPTFTRRGDTRHGTVSMQCLTGPQGVSRELAADLLAARLVHDLEFGKRSFDTTMLLAGDSVPDRLLNAVADAAERSGTQLLVFFERLSDNSGNRLGWRGAPVAGFFRLPNPKEAQLAADFLGKQHTFVLAGTSDSTGSSFEWGWSTTHTRGTDHSTSTSWQLGRNFSSTLSRSSSTSSSVSHATSGGASTNRGHTDNYSRVYEHLLDPSVFQGLDTGAVLLVDASTRSARLATCNRDVAKSKLVDWDHQYQLGP